MIDLLALADRLEQLMRLSIDTDEPVTAQDQADLRDAALVLRRVQTVIEWCDHEDLVNLRGEVQAKAHVRSLLQPPTGVE